MLWVLLAWLGVPIWLLVVGIGVVILGRRRAARMPGTFRLKVRLRSGSSAGLADHWPRQASRGRWVHDVLLVHHGPALNRVLALPVREADGAVKDLPAGAVKGLGDRPVAVAFRLDDDAHIEVAAPREKRELAVGPYVAAEIERSGGGQDTSETGDARSFDEG